MTFIRACLLASLCCLPVAGTAAMLDTPLTDSALDEITGQQGIAVNLELRINAKVDGEPVDATECPTVGALTGGTSCRLAFSLADRDGMWIVMKSYRGIIKLTNIRLDATTFGANTAYNGNPYLGAYSPSGKPAIRLTSGNWANPAGANCEAAPAAAACRTYLNQPNYADMFAAISIDKMTIEYDAGVTPGYLRNAIGGAAIALRLAHGIGLVPDPDNPPDVKIGPYTNTPAQVRLDGRLQIHGF